MGLIYTWVRTPDSDRLVIPNEKLVSETLRNATIRNERPVAEVMVQLPLSADLRAAVEALEPGGERGPRDRPRRAGDDRGPPRRRCRRQSVEQAQSDLRIEVAERLREAGILVPASRIRHGRQPRARRFLAHALRRASGSARTGSAAGIAPGSSSRRPASVLVAVVGAVGFGAGSGALGVVQPRPA